MCGADAAIVEFLDSGTRCWIGGSQPSSRRPRRHPRSERTHRLQRNRAVDVHEVGQYNAKVVAGMALRTDVGKPRGLTAIDDVTRNELHALLDAAGDWAPALTTGYHVNIVVIGGGIIGTVGVPWPSFGGNDRCRCGRPRFGTSIGNAGHIVVSHSIPFAAPGMVKVVFAPCSPRMARSLYRPDLAKELDWLIGFAAAPKPIATFTLTTTRDEGRTCSGDGIDINPRTRASVHRSRSSRNAPNAKPDTCAPTASMSATRRGRIASRNRLDRQRQRRDRTHRRSRARPCPLVDARVNARRRRCPLDDRRGDNVRIIPTVRTADGDATLDADAVILAAGVVPGGGPIT